MEPLLLGKETKRVVALLELLVKGCQLYSVRKKLVEQIRLIQE